MAEPETTVSYSEPSAHTRSPTVSIGMPVYNGAESIRHALDSLLSQTYTDFMVIVSDNASSDGTEEILKEYALRDSRLSYVRQPKNIGGEANFKFVFHATNSEYFMWAAADDIRSPDFIEKNLQFLENHKDYLASTLRTKFKGGEFDQKLMGDESLDQDDFSQRLISFFQSWHANGRYYSLFRREAVNHWIDRDWDFLGSDWSLITQIASVGKLNRIDAGWVELGWHGTSNTTNIVARYRKGMLCWLFPFHRLVSSTWRLAKQARPSQRIHLLWRLTELNFRAFVYQFIWMRTRRR